MLFFMIRARELMHREKPSLWGKAVGSSMETFLGKLLRVCRRRFLAG